MQRYIGQFLKIVGSLLDAFPYPILVPIALLLAAAPFQPEPHLFETTRMLVAGELTEPIYIFDFFMHGTGLFLLMAKIGRDVGRKRSEEAGDEGDETEVRRKD